MKAKHKDVKTHPLINSILAHRKVFIQIQEKSKHLKHIAIKVLTDHHLIANIAPLERIAKVEELTVVTVEDTDGHKISENGETDKRRATYEIVKNKGLMPRRKKELRNPRVKHRKKYRRALIRRRTQVPEVKERNGPYEGEPTGIKAGLKRSVKLM